VKNWYWPGEVQQSQQIFGPHWVLKAWNSVRLPGTWPVIHHLTDEDIAGGRILLGRGILAAPWERRANLFCHWDPPAFRQRSLWDHLGLFNGGSICRVQLLLLLTRNKSHSSLNSLWKLMLNYLWCFTCAKWYTAFGHMLRWLSPSAHTSCLWNHLYQIDFDNNMFLWIGHDRLFKIVIRMNLLYSGEDV
jgi:hypothetical protein